MQELLVQVPALSRPPTLRDFWARLDTLHWGQVRQNIAAADAAAN